MEERIISNKQNAEDEILDSTLRPRKLAEFIGQEKIKDNLNIFMEAARRRGEPIEHVLLYGPPGLGKCINPDSIIFTEQGMIKIGSLSQSSKKGFTKKKIKVFSQDSEAETSHFYNNGKSKTIKTKTHQGYELEGTPNHPIIVLERGEMKFKKLEDLKLGDYVAIGRGQNYFGKIIRLPRFKFRQNKSNTYDYSQYTIPKVMTQDLAKICGYLVGDAYIGRWGEIAFSCEEPEIQQDYIKTWKKVFNQELKVQQWGKKCPVIRCKNMMIREFLINIGLPHSTAHSKEIPHTIMQAPKEIVAEFLRAYFECDGHIRPNCRQVDVITASAELACALQIVLLNFGIVSRRYQDFHKKENMVYHRVYITGGDAEIFCQKIGFISKKKRMAGRDFSPRKNTNKDLVPFGKDKVKELKKIFVELNGFLEKKHYRRTATQEISISEMNNCLVYASEYISKAQEKIIDYQKTCNPNIFWDKIETIKENFGQTVDLTIPVNHRFFANGFINHNTTLAHIIANEMGVNIRVTSGPAIERAGDLAAILTNLEDGDVLFIDECHRLNKVIEEILYPAMEDYSLDIVVGKGPSARTLKLDLPKFTLIGATTRISLLSSPLRDRFGNIYHLDFYEEPEIEKIIHRSSRILNVNCDNDAACELASRARYTPRIANRLLKRVRDYAQVMADGNVSSDLAKIALDKLEIDPLGLDRIDRRILEVIIEKFSGGPVGLNSISAATAEEMETIEDIYEPFLLRLGFIQRTPRGRIVTEAGYKHLGMNPPGDLQNKLV